MESGQRDQHQHPNTVAAASDQEEALKRNTDCVYFLASPLTCKKGADCEYRHSEGARMNPRDCWYWLNGNCLNPKCAFRHPPLEGLLGAAGASAGSLVASQTAAMQMPAVHSPAGYNGSKQSVPCFYFQKGLCLKGDRCPFMHGSQPIVNSAPQQTSKVTASVTEPPHALKKASGALEKCISQQKTTQVSIVESVELPSMANHNIKADIAPNNEKAAQKTVTPTSSYEEPPRSKQSNVPLFSGNAMGKRGGPQLQVPEEHLQNGREAGELLRESSPGFDVLVDDELENSDYFHHEDEYGRAMGNVGRHLSTMNEFDFVHPSDHDRLAKFDREMYEFCDYEHYGRTRDQYGWEQHKAASERILEQPSMLERRRPREESPDQIDRSDLRHRLLKQRKINGSRSAISPDHRIEINRRDNRYGDEQRYRGRQNRDQQYFPSESSISNRLQGRIMLPGRSSPDKANDLRSDREIHGARNWGRSSPGRPVSYHQGRHHDRIRRTHENFTADARNCRGQPIKKDEIDTLDFAGPKSLAELKGAKFSDSNENCSTKNDSVGAHKGQLVGELKTMKLGKAMGQPEGSLSFEGPKPLSEILKRKKEGASGNGTVSSDGEDIGHRERVHQIGSSGISATETPTLPVCDSNKAGGMNAGAYAVEENDNSDGSPDKSEGYKLMHDGPTSAEKVEGQEMQEVDDGTMIDTMEDQELEAYDQREGESDYDMVEGGDFKTEYENHEPEDEYLDDEDGDDFSSRIGAMFS